MKRDICIIGGGASGMAAAIAAKEANPSKSVIIIEKKNGLGRKLLATGNGKCNITNTACEEYEQIKNFFAKMGLAIRTDEQGRCYPYTEESKAVLGALTRRLEQLDVEVLSALPVVEIGRSACGGFAAHLTNKTVESKQMILACGGKAGSTFGTTGDGFGFAKAFGHSVNKPVPVLTAVDTKEDMTALAGIRAKGKVRLLYCDKVIFEETGEIQFTKTGISGICVFNMSRFLLIPEGKKFTDGFDDYRIEIDFFPEEINVREILMSRVRSGFEGAKLLDFMVRKPIADIIYEEAQGDVVKSAQMLKAFPLSPKGVKGWDFAQATKGGVPFDEVDEETFESKICKGLYFAGEILDYDGPCGGFNLNHAWVSGRKAGKAAANAL